MKIGPIDLDKEVLIIAEVGNNHEGSYTLAEELIGLAAEAGAGAVKFQTIIPEQLVTSSETQRIEQLKKFQLNYSDFERLAKYAERQKIVFLSTPFDVESVEFLNNIVPAFKIASGDNNFFALLEAVCKTGKPIIMSTGLAKDEELKKSIKYINECWKNNNTTSFLTILHCITNYPVAPENANLLSIPFLKAKFNLPVGYSDHTLGIDACIAAVTLGARIIEKHFSIDKNYSTFRDHQLSADPQEMKALVKKIKEITLLMGTSDNNLKENENSIKINVRRSIAAKHTIAAGTIIKLEDLTWLRPGTGLPPGNENFLIGKKSKYNLAAGQLIYLSDIE